MGGVQSEGPWDLRQAVWEPLRSKGLVWGNGLGTGCQQREREK